MRLGALAQEEEIRHSAQVRLRLDTPGDVTGYDIASAIHNRIDLFDYVNIYFVIGMAYTSFAPWHVGNRSGWKCLGYHCAGSTSDGLRDLNRR